MRPLFVVRADAGLDIGAGHVMRSMVLAEVLAARGWRIGLACRPGTLEAVPRAQALADGICILDGPEKDEAEAMATRWPQGCALLLVDHYQRGFAFEQACRHWAQRIAVLEDGHRRHDCDLLIDQGHGRTAAGHRPFVPAHCTVMAGCAQALLRPEFAVQRNAALARRDGRPVSRLLVSMGGTDGANATSAVLTALQGLDPGIAVDVVLGAAAPHLTPVAAQVAAFGPQAHLHVDPPSMAELMVEADLTIGAGGSTLWERACLGLPSLVAIVADNQREACTSMARDGAVVLLDSLEPVHVREQVQALLTNDMARRKLARRSAALVDGTGAWRIAARLEPESWAA
ncbi:UDP-2,4-diacetamido-2,4,6-trideoxy-beta-L-altropyranose hydrolase [Zavarzinia sp. CC-PAN008]|uniref:UDP-2,4-diacetamido-2,4, 6-trideoxy-beta-L-altropyranose hydrolase n=1 Tax=Zavarzinia sp. CC-PAN008 TaxID=3243332 RepID=UPI003F74754E